MQGMHRKSELNFVHVKFDMPIIFTNRGIHRAV